jgi:hypothetical protein
MWTEECGSWRRGLPLFLGWLIFEDIQQKTGDSIPWPAASEPGCEFKGSMDYQGTGKRKAGQIVALSIPDLHDSYLDLSQYELRGHQLGKRWHRNLQGDLRRTSQVPTGHHEGSSYANVKSRTKLQKSFPSLIHATDENWNRYWQALPSPPFSTRNYTGH